jgi:hypothetical protein
MKVTERYSPHARLRRRRLCLERRFGNSGHPERRAIFTQMQNLHPSFPGIGTSRSQ